MGILTKYTFSHILGLFIRVQLTFCTVQCFLSQKHHYIPPSLLGEATAQLQLVKQLLEGGEAGVLSKE